MDHRKTYALVMVALLVGSYALITIDNGDPNLKHIDTRYGNYDFEYHDSYFSRPASEYNPDLAVASYCLAMSGSGVEGDSYSIADAVPREFADELGFVNFEANDDFLRTPTKDSLGVSVSMKEVFDGYTVLMINFRLGLYGSEWANNFDVGYGDSYGNHEGFKKCADKTIAFVDQYIDGHGISGKIKIWVAGYSRTGGVTNMLAGVLDTAIAEKRTVLHNVSICKDDIYAYTFEAPKTVAPTGPRNVNGEDYDNIWNYIRPADFIPMAPPQSWGFKHYGTELFFPDLPFDAKIPEWWNGFMDLYLARDGSIDKLTTHAYRMNDDNEIIQIDDPEYPSLSVEFNLFMSALGSGVGTRADFADGYQSMFERLMDITHGSINILGFFTDLFAFIEEDELAFDLVWDIFWEDKDGFKEDISDCVKRSLAKNGLDTSRTGEMTDVLWDVVELLLSAMPHLGEDPELEVTVLMNITSIPNMHADYDFMFCWLVVASR